MGFFESAMRGFEESLNAEPQQVESMASRVGQFEQQVQQLDEMGVA